LICYFFARELIRTNQPPAATCKRTAILEGAKAVFLRQSFSLATMDDVAAAAGVGKQTVYRHFGSKEALFVGLVVWMCAQVGALLAGAQGAQPNGTPEVELRRLGWSVERVL
jgi:TetR/AcrR family transcriptional repressor of mexJK operon